MDLDRGVGVEMARRCQRSPFTRPSTAALEYSRSSLVDGETLSGGTPGRVQSGPQRQYSDHCDEPTVKTRQGTHICGTTVNRSAFWRRERERRYLVSSGACTGDYDPPKGACHAPFKSSDTGRAHRMFYFYAGTPAKTEPPVICVMGHPLDDTPRDVALCRSCGPTHRECRRVDQSIFSLPP